MASTYQLSAEMQSFVNQCALFQPADDSLSEMRVAYDALCRYFTPVLPDGLQVEDHLLLVAGRHIPLRSYRPAAPMPPAGWPCVLYLHGGGWILGGLDSHAFIAAPLAQECAAAVLVVDYRLAPEHVFPAAFEDCMAVWDQLRVDGLTLGINASRIVVAGDSAGGNLAAALCMAARGKDGPALRGQALIYPALAADPSPPAAIEHAAAPLLSRVDMAYYLAQYAPDPATHADPRLAPLMEANLQGLPPAFVAVAEYDPLRDDGLCYVQRLLAHGIAAECHVGRGLLHGCLRFWPQGMETARMYRALVTALRRLLAGQA
ncbi:alpha/beta hydrolase [Aquitalea aquatica]|uniref:Alpha/beta hydrolase n=1 Tax=Aquitalea aquatica TaxID=3044273 RepID=A0A838Y3S4_9NEIS|nr:alpha/beta hydrolase [Aquitalea magnusonii]MBA4707197.1 alpha/beta hydrolase [Aquitalea magnusonii]